MPNEETKSADTSTETEKPNEEPKTNESLITEIKAEFEKKLSEQAKTFTEKLAERDKIIKDLVAGSDTTPKKPSPIEELNARRIKQCNI